MSVRTWMQPFLPTLSPKVPDLQAKAEVAQAPPSPRKVFCSRDDLEMIKRGHGEYSCPRCDARKNIKGGS